MVTREVFEGLSRGCHDVANIGAPFIQGIERELADLAGPQPVRRADLAHLNFGSGESAPFEQIDEVQRSIAWCRTNRWSPAATSTP